MEKRKDGHWEWQGKRDEERGRGEFRIGGREEIRDVDDKFGRMVKEGTAAWEKLRRVE